MATDTKQTHTPTPWRIGKDGGTVVADVPIPEIGGANDVAYYGGYLVAESITPRNAAFIVRACNAHDELLAALQLIAHAEANEPAGDTWKDIASRCMAIAGEALAKAEGR